MTKCCHPFLMTLSYSRGRPDRAEQLGSRPPSLRESQLCGWSLVGKGTECPWELCLCLGMWSPKGRGELSPDSQGIEEARRRRRTWG